MLKIPHAGDSSNILDSIKIDNENKFSLQNISDTYKVDDEYIFQYHSILNEYRLIIFSYLIDVEITENEFYLPELTSRKNYGTTDLWYLVLFCNNIPNKYRYTNKNIKIFNPRYMNVLNQIIELNFKRLSYQKKNPISIKTSQIHDIL